MTVKELIQQLESLPQDFPVLVDDYDYPDGWALSHVDSVARHWFATDKDSEFNGKDVECVLIGSGDWFPSPIK
jgi:hypothetical protein